MASRQYGKYAVSTSLAKRESGSRGVRDNVTSDGLLGVSGEGGRAVNLSDNLVRNDNGNTELVCKAHQPSEELGPSAFASPTAQPRPEKSVR